MSRETDLPSYSRPPLVEVAIAVHFTTDEEINAGHLGAFWSQVRKRFSFVQSMVPIPSPRDDTGAKWTPSSFKLALTNKPNCRLQMTNGDDDDAWMWQVQSDRLVVNWRKRPSTEYPRYSKTVDEFRDAWSQWSRFLEDIGVTGLAPDSWELTYVNEVPSGPDQWPDIFPGLFGGPFVADSGLQLAGLDGEWVWDHEDPKARLIVSPTPAKREDRDALMLTLTARGRVSQPDSAEDTQGSGSNAMNACEAGLNLGHRLIVNTFDRISSDTAKHQHWGRQ